MIKGVSTNHEQDKKKTMQVILKSNKRKSISDYEMIHIEDQSPIPLPIHDRLDRVNSLISIDQRIESLQYCQLAYALEQPREPV